MTQSLIFNFEIFLSYSRKDNQPTATGPDGEPEGWVSALYRHLLEDHRRFSTEPLRIFFDQNDIHNLDDWRHRILKGLQSSRILLVCLSPNYLASEYCRWEWEEYQRRQVHRLMGSDSVASVYFVEAPGSGDVEVMHWCEELMRTHFTDMRPWFDAGAGALRQAEVRQRLEALGTTLWERIQRARRAMAVPGNLRRHNPHFVGRRDELRRLHEHLALGTVGVVTTVQGLGGQGKTELALAYAHAFADHYPAGLWSVAAEGATELLSLIGQLAFDPALGLNVPSESREDGQRLGRAVLEYLRQRAAQAAGDGGIGRTLILLDNVSDAALLSPDQLAQLPGGLGGDWLRLLATTRLALEDRKQQLAVVPLDALDEDSALSLMRDHQPPRNAQGQVVADLEQSSPGFASAAEEQAARDIVRLLGGFTLAVEQVAVHLGLHPDVSPSAFLALLQRRGLTMADALPAQVANVAERMRAQSKQLGLILDQTLAQLDRPARTALAFAARLPPDLVPWPWLRELVVAQHPELAETDDLGRDPWMSQQRRLLGLRLVTGGEQTEVARMHRVVAAQLVQAGSASDNAPGDIDHDDALRRMLVEKAGAFSSGSAQPLAWEVDALMACLGGQLQRDAVAPGIAAEVTCVCKRLQHYRPLESVQNLAMLAHQHLRKSVDTDPGNAGSQREMSMSLHRLGAIAKARGDLDRAEALFHESLAIARRLAEAAPENTGVRSELAASLHCLGDIAKDRGELGWAESFHCECLAIYRRLSEVDPDCRRWQHELSLSLFSLGNIVRMQRDLPRAKELVEEGLTIQRHFAQSHQDNNAMALDLAASITALGCIADAMDDRERALALFSEALELRRRGAESDPSNKHSQNELSEALSNLGRSSFRLGEVDALLSESVAIRRRLVESDPNNAVWRSALSIALRELGCNDAVRREYDNVESLFRESVAIARNLGQAYPEWSDAQQILAESLEMLGDEWVSQVGDEREAEHLLSEAIAVRRRSVECDPGNPSLLLKLSRSLSILARFVKSQGDLDRAVALLGERAFIIRRLAANEPRHTGLLRELHGALDDLLHAVLESGDERQASDLVEEINLVADQLEKNAQSVAHWLPPRSSTKSELPDFAKTRGDGDRTESLTGVDLAIARSLAEADPSNACCQRDLSRSLRILGDLARQRGDLCWAEALLEESLAIDRRLVESDECNANWQGELSNSLMKLGQVAGARRNLDRAETLSGEALAIRRRLVESEPDNILRQSDLSASLMRLAHIAQAQGDYDKAETFYVEALPIIRRHNQTQSGSAGSSHD